MGRLARQLGFLVDGLSGTAAGPSARGDGISSCSDQEAPAERRSAKTPQKVTDDLVTVPFSVQGELGDYILEASVGIGFDEERTPVQATR